ncbi:hypothetical protein [Bifidobacterium vespertilionis]|uniref:hypothetical protein n=1 Tax=Bifidobacterium vespertilionis TaxID=2562524 RepID=UPI00168207A1|nr:hypothetical protein [Bifidobacterium vespertilionis]
MQLHGVAPQEARCDRDHILIVSGIANHRKPQKISAIMLGTQSSPSASRAGSVLYHQ